MSADELYACPCSYTVGSAPELCPECGRKSTPWPRDDDALRRLNGTSGNGDDAPPVPESRSAPQSRTLSDLAQLAEEDPIAWLVPRTIVEGGVHVVHGKEESFKTTLVMQLLEALNVGGQFLCWDLPGGLRVGFAELEMTEKIFRQRARSFMKPTKQKAEILVLSADQRRKILDGKSAEARVRLLLEWVKENGLDVLGIDSLAKLFPPDANIGSQSAVSDVFNQLQKLGCTVILIAHPRKRGQAVDPKAEPHGNEEIAGSGRFAQDPDIVLEMVRSDRRSPKAVLNWGKNRMDFKPDDLPLFFDAVEHRLYPVHPFLHLLPASREQLVRESARRFGWKRSRVDEEIVRLKALEDVSGSPLVVETCQDRQAVFSLADSRVSLSKLVEKSDWEQSIYEPVAPMLEGSKRAGGNDVSADPADDSAVVGVLMQPLKNQSDVSTNSACDTPTAGRGSRVGADD